MEDLLVIREKGMERTDSQRERYEERVISLPFSKPPVVTCASQFTVIFTLSRTRGSNSGLFKVSYTYSDWEGYVREYPWGTNLTQLSLYHYYIILLKKKQKTAKEIQVITPFTDV